MNSKKITSLFLAALSFGSIKANAQIEKRTIFLGGISAFNVSPREISDRNGSQKNNNTNFWINSRGGYYLSKSFALGISIDYHHSRIYETVNTINPTLHYREQERTQNSLGFSILARYNKPLSKRFAFFAEGTLSTQVWDKTNNYLKETNAGITTVISGETKGKIDRNIALVVRPGITYFVSPKFGIDATFANIFANYANTKPDAANGYTSSKGFSTGYSFFPAVLSLGAHFYIAPKPKKQIREEEE